MALKGTWGTFVHIPKCGGLSMRRYLRDHLGRGVEVGDFHGLPGEIDRGFTLVRHPISWLVSLWTYRTNDDWRINPKSVNNWPVIVGLTQWAAGLTWPEFVDALAEHQVDIPGHVYGMYRHHNVRVYQLERVNTRTEKLHRLQGLLRDLGIDHELPLWHATPDKPVVTNAQYEKLARVCARSMSDYGYDA